jgi:hypothetical protein
MRIDPALRIKDRRHEQHGSTLFTDREPESVSFEKSGSPAITVGDFTCGREGSVLSVRR